jgi:tripeptide aminopeptidase
MKNMIQQLNDTLLWDTFLPEIAQWVIEEGIRIQQIPSPTFEEEQCATYVLGRFADFGLKELQIDEQKNVYGLLKGTSKALGVMMMAHTDTVFPMETDLTVNRMGDDIIVAPGIGDNSLGVSGMLGFLKYLQDSNTTPPCDIWFVATSCEEGLGDLNGVRHAYAKLKDKIGVVINLEGLALGHVYHAGISVHRLHITIETEGGHSWLHFGKQSAIHILMQIGARISNIHPPKNPRTTYNIGIIEGGQSVNSIASEAGLWLDLRSEEQGELDKLKAQITSILKSYTQDDVKIIAKVVGNRPSGYINPKHALIEGAMTALQMVGIRGTLENGSTDGNIPLSEGCPTVTIGITRGGNAHRLDEFMEISPVKQGMKQLIMLGLATATSQSQLKISGV